MSYNSIHFNSASIELEALKGASPDALAGLQAQLGGDVVQEYDKQIQSFTAELTATNAEKSAIEKDKRALSVLGAKRIVIDDGDNKTSEAKENYQTKTVDGGVAYSTQFSGEACLMTQSEFEDFKELALKNGVEVTDFAVSGSGKNISYALRPNLIESLKDALDGKLKDLNSTSEIKLINYQALMDARKQAMMMLSNMLSSDHQAKMSVIQNLKG